MLINSLETNLNTKTKNIEHKIIDTKAISEKIVETIFNTNASSLRQKNNTKLNQIDFIKQLIDQELYPITIKSNDVIHKSPSTKLLSAVDSIELFSKCIHRKLPSSAQRFEVDTDESNNEKIPKCSRAKLIEVQDSLEIIHNKILLEQYKKQQQLQISNDTINNKINKSATTTEKYPTIRNDKYLSSFNKLPSYLIDLRNEIQLSTIRDINESITSNKNNEWNDELVSRFEEYETHKLSTANADEELLKRVQIADHNKSEIPIDESLVQLTKLKSILRTPTIASSSKNKKPYISDHPITKGNIRMRTLLELMKRDENVTEILKENFFSILN